MRVTETMKLSGLMANNAESASRLHDASARASSGKRVRGPADDPGAFAQIARYEGAIATYESRKVAVDRAADDLAFAEGALASAADLMARARELAVQMADGAVAPADRAIAAKEVTQIRQQLVGIANSRSGEGYVFGGSRVDVPPFDAAGAFVGNDVAIPVEVAEGVRVRQNASGAQAFTAAGGRDILQDLDAFVTALSTNDVAGVSAMVGHMASGHGQITAARSEVGLTLDRLRMASTAAHAGRDAILRARAGVEELDATEAYLGLTRAQQAYERSLEVTRKLLSIASPDQLLAR